MGKEARLLPLYYSAFPYRSQRKKERRTPTSDLELETGFLRKAFCRV